MATFRRPAVIGATALLVVAVGSGSPVIGQTAAAQVDGGSALTVLIDHINATADVNDAVSALRVDFPLSGADREALRSGGIVVVDEVIRCDRREGHPPRCGLPVGPVGATLSLVDQVADAGTATYLLTTFVQRGDGGIVTTRTEAIVAHRIATGWEIRDVQHEASGVLMGKSFQWVDHAPPGGY